MTSDAAAAWTRRSFPQVSWSGAAAVSGAFHTVVLGARHVARVSSGREHADRAGREWRTAVAIADAVGDSTSGIVVPEVVTDLVSDAEFSGYLLSRLPASDEPPSEWAIVRPAYERLLDLLSTTAVREPLPPARSWCGGERWLDIVARDLAPLMGDDARAAESAAQAVDDLPRSAPALVHGDLGPHNILWRGSDAAALIDWDHACLDDPAIDVAPLIGFYGARSIREIASGEVVSRALLHRATLPLQVAAAAHTVGDAALRDHALRNFRSRLHDGTLHDPGGDRP